MEYEDNYLRLLQLPEDRCNQQANVGLCAFYSHLGLPWSEKQTSITIGQFPTGSHTQRATVSTVNSCYFQPCARRSQPWQVPHVMKILVLKNGNSHVTAVNLSCLQKGGTSPVELFLCFILKAVRKKQSRIL